MSLEKLVSKYIASAEHVLGEIEMVAENNMCPLQTMLNRFWRQQKPICKMPNIIGKQRGLR